MEEKRRRSKLSASKIALVVGSVLSIGTGFWLKYNGSEDTRNGHRGREAVAKVYRTWSEITDSDTLRIGTMTSPLDFFIYRGQEFGLEYRKILAFGKKNNLEIDIHLATHEDSLRLWLDQGRIDLCITPFAMTKTNTDEFKFCGMVDTIALFLVQKKQYRDSIITSDRLRDLNDKEVYVVENTIEHMRMQQVKMEAGLTELRITPVDTLGTEDLIALVSKVDTMQYTVADQRLAQLFARHFSNLDVDTRISVPIRYGWITHLGNDTLAMKIDEYFASSDVKRHFGLLLKYDITSSKFFVNEAGNPIKYKFKNGGISPYDDLFRVEARRLGWHWTYLAAIAFQESRFDSSVVGWSGARGLMGIMPATGRAFGASTEELLNPEVNVRVSVDCLLEYGKIFRNNPNAEERMRFTLASYNAGSGHVMDAIRLAEKYGAPTNVWYGGVREYFLLKSTPKYYNDPVVKNGYVRGSETVKYVDQIMKRGAMYTALAERK